MLNKVLGTIIVASIGFVGLSASVNAAPITLTFDASQPESPSYFESGMTITQVGSYGIRVTGGIWDSACCPTPHNDIYELTASAGTFDFLSIDILHSDNGDPVQFDGYFNSVLMSTTTINASDFGALNLVGFTGLDMVVISVTGTYSDAKFDNLTYDAATVTNPEPVSEPGTFAILGLGLVGLGFARRRKTA